jgi:hypothetical protein
MKGPRVRLSDLNTELPRFSREMDGTLSMRPEILTVLSGFGRIESRVIMEVLEVFKVEECRARFIRVIRIYLNWLM